MTAAVAFREPLDVDLPAARAVLALRGEDRPFALLGAWAGGGALLGARPVRVVAGEEVLPALDDQPAVEGGGDVVGGGWFGYFGFQLGRAVERLDPAPPPAVALPAGALGFYDHLLRREPDGRWYFEALMTPEREAAILARRDELLARLRAAPEPRPFAARDWRWTPSPGAHARLVEACRERIHAGDLFQANLTLRLEGRIEGDALDLFATAAERLPTDRAAFVAGPWGTVASLSPELFLERRGRAVRSEPIKGTRPAGRRAELERSEKDRAENVMIVDLMRNDLGRVCEPGSIEVPAIAEVRPHAGVWHMVSEIRGTLREGTGDGALLRATFPPGSVTGAPKVAALNVIAELESVRREVYTGAIGFASPLAGLELAVAIRTFEVRGQRIWVGAGGGIVADSDPAAEAAEAAEKVAPLLAAIGSAPPPDAPAPAAGTPAPLRRGPRPLPRPDPAAGIYTTLAVRDGVAVDWAAHRERLADSLRALYGLTLPGELDEAVAAATRAAATARLRVDVAPGEPPRLTAGELPPPGEPVLRPVLLPGGLGAHKWRDRRLLEQHEADDPSTLPLLVDADGTVLETSRTAVAVRDAGGRLYAPPHDGRILPSTALARHGARPRTLTLEDLAAAPEILVASALRGLQRARLLA